MTTIKKGTVLIVQDSRKGTYTGMSDAEYETMKRVLNAIARIPSEAWDAMEADE